MEFTSIINPFHSSSIQREHPIDLWEWMSNIEMRSRRQEQKLVELEQSNKHLEERIEELENEKIDLATYVDELENRVRINEEGTSQQLEKQVNALQQLFAKQNKSDATIRDTQAVIERLLSNVSKVERIGTSNEN
jgi:predicted RNase H-like nuclease (RuvC/YqgF family)